MSQDKFSTSPKNQAFLDYLQTKKQGNVISTANSGHPLGAIPPVTVLPKYEVNLAKETMFPENYDLRSEGRVTDVKNQSPLGTCWAFATYGSLESNLLPSETTDFSENNLINNHGFDNSPDAGGNLEMSSAYLTRWDGPMNEDDDPYTGIVHNSPANIYPIKHVQEIRLVNPNDRDSIKSLLMEHGAIFAYMWWSDAYYNPNSFAYYSNATGNSTNHAVTIVGWDDNYNSANFSIAPPGNGAFIIKNSWGANWGDSGYFYISYYDQQFAPAAVFTVAEPISNFKGIYQHDLFGFLGYLYSNGSRTISMANMFTATSDDPIAAVSFYTLYPSTACTINVYTSCSGSPTSGVPSPSKSFTSDFMGYQTVRLDTPISVTKDTKFSIIVTLTVPEGYNSYAASEWKIQGFSSNVTINPGESFISIDGIDWTDISGIQDCGNFCLKAFTTEITPVETIVSFEPLMKTVGKRPNSQYSDEFTVQVIIKDLPTGQSVLGFHDTITFDPGLLEVVKCEMPQDCLLNPIIGDPILDIDNTTGIIDFNLARSETSYPNSNGVVFNITLKAKATGNTNLVHQIADLRDDLGNGIARATENCAIEIVDLISLIGDFNYDGKIDFEDLLLFAKAWNHKSGDTGWDTNVSGLYGTPYKYKDIGPATGTPPDLSITPDDIVDIKDYSVFVQMWKWIRTQNIK